MTKNDASYETILLSLEGGIARLTLNRPDKLNSFNVRMHEEVQRALQSVRGQGARVLVLSGAGRGFCAGQDLADRAVAPGTQGVDLGESIERYYKPLVLALQNLPMPVIAAVNGVAAGAGANIALACDLVVAARSASFVQPFYRLGLGLTLLGEKLSAEQAAAWGMIWRCIDDAEFPQAVDALAAQLAAAPTRGLAATKAAIRSSWQHSLAEQLNLERDAQRELGRSQDYAEGVAAFTAKRTANFQGR